MGTATAVCCLRIPTSYELTDLLSPGAESESGRALKPGGAAAGTEIGIGTGTEIGIGGVTGMIGETGGGGLVLIPERGIGGGTTGIVAGAGRKKGVGGSRRGGGENRK